MPVEKAWVFRCACGCARNQVFSSATHRMKKREAEKEANAKGWRELYGDWYAAACSPRIKREKRAEARRKIEVSA